jgi:hypothetical protein
VPSFPQNGATGNLAPTKRFLRIDGSEYWCC